MPIKTINNQGSLLLEALMVIVILAVGLTFIIQSLSSSMRALNYANNYYQAAFLIDQKLSEMLINKNIEESFQDSGQFDLPFDAYHFQISAQAMKWPDEDSPSENVNQITLKIDWPSGSKTQDLSATLCLLHKTEDKNQRP